MASPFAFLRGSATVMAAGEETEVEIDPKGEPLAYVFKTRIDEFLGQVGDDDLGEGITRMGDFLAG